MIERTAAAAEPLLERLLDGLAASVDADRRPLAREFGRAVVRRIPQEQLEAADPDTVVAQLTDGFRFVLHREPGELAIRITDVDVPAARDEVPGAVIQVLIDDRPFVVASIRAELAHRGYETVRLFHPILGVERDRDGNLTAIVPARGAERRESFVHAQIDRRLSATERDDLAEALRDVLLDVVHATRDFDAMQRRVERLATELRAWAAEGVATEEAEEVASLLEWVLDDNFVLLGCREYEVVGDDPHVRVRPDSELGILAERMPSSYADPVPLTDADEHMRQRHETDRLLTVSRSHRYSTVRKRERLINIWVKEIGDDGSRGQFRLIGLFSRKARALASSTVPVLRNKLRDILEQEDVVEKSYDERALIELFHALPLDELLELDAETLRETLVGLFNAEQQREIAVFRRIDRTAGSISIIVSIPPDRYDADLRRRVQSLLRSRYGTSRVDVDLALGDRPETIARFSFPIPTGELPDVALSELREEIRAIARTWEDDLADLLAERHGEADGRRLAADIGARLPATYREHTPPAHAVDDVADLADLLRTGDDLRIRFHADPRPHQGFSRVKILKAGSGIELSRILPILESVGLTVAEELPFRVGEGADELHVHDYGVHVDGATIDVDAHGPRLATAIEAAWRGRLETDSLNQLVLRADLSWEEAGLLRALRRYRRQVGTVYTSDYQNAALVAHPVVARRLVDYFDARFDPDVDAEDDEIAAHRQRVVDALDEVERLDEDRILRDLLGLIDATVRTNRYRDPTPSELALKIDSTAVPRMSKPVPHREVFVYSPTVEGIHLRGGPVARGGIRWSDRRDDYRAEALDLMQAQMLKNALIVPDGAKGAFVVKRSDAAADDPRGAAQRAYERYINALLDITDDVEGETVVGPPGVRRHDGDDAYLVVAADRGTATFSDFANAIAEERGFWLGDAFASGGSSGYDHKELGITARGAWVAVRRHFRELGIDVDRETVRVIGVGDMSGDVFGNAMLRSEAIQLVAAFDHRDVFIDPDPDPARSYEERRRLFELESSSWQDYDTALISRGGGVWSREDKAIPLSDEVRELLGVGDGTLAPPALLRSLLRAPVDLIFFGGIGTFVKASDQSDEETGDRTNAEIRVDAGELRARVVGEGANLALTQRARVQYARRGGHLNTDFIDNAAGVDISDHEVNLKILLRVARERDAHALDDRGRTLAEVSDEVVATCLADVDRQTWALYVEAVSSAETIEHLEELMASLERRDQLDRDVESLPGSEEMAERAEAGAGLTRPELAVLLATAKRDLTRDLLASDLTEDPALRPLLVDYFPSLLAERFDAVLDHHRLRRELIVTRLASEVIDRMGITFVHALVRETGVDPIDVTAAWWVSRQLLRAGRCFEAIEHVDHAGDPDLAVETDLRLRDLLASLTREYVRSTDVGEDLERRIAADRDAFREVEEVARSRPDRSDEVAGHAERLVEAGVETDVAIVLARIQDLAIAPDVASIARATGREPAGVADAFTALDEALGLERLRRLLDTVATDDRWAERQHTGLVSDLRGIHRVAAHRALTEHPELNEQEAVHRFVGRRGGATRRARALAREIDVGDETARLDAVSVAVRAVQDAIRAPDERP